MFGMLGRLLAIYLISMNKCYPCPIFMNSDAVSYNGYLNSVEVMVDKDDEVEKDWILHTTVPVHWGPDSVKSVECFEWNWNWTFLLYYLECLLVVFFLYDQVDLSSLSLLFTILWMSFQPKLSLPIATGTVDQQIRIIWYADMLCWFGGEIYSFFLQVKPYHSNLWITMKLSRLSVGISYAMFVHKNYTIILEHS